MFSISTSTTSPTWLSQRSSNLGGVGRLTSRSLSKVLQDMCLGLQVLFQYFVLQVERCQSHLRTAGVAPFVGSSISVLLVKGRSQCVMLMMWRKKWEMSGTNASPPCFDGLKKGDYYLILHNMLQYYSITILQTYIEILQSKMESSSSRVVILSMGRTFR